MSDFLVSGEAAAARFVAEAESWVGTPFAERGTAKGKGGGVDCINLVQEVFLRSVGGSRVLLPGYTLDENLHTYEPRLERAMDSNPQLLKIASIAEDVKRKVLLLDKLPLLPGDIIGFRIVNVVHHLGIAVGGRRFIHCVRQMGTIESYCDDATFERRIMVVYRPLKV